MFVCITLLYFFKLELTNYHFFVIVVATYIPLPQRQYRNKKLISCGESLPVLGISCYAAVLINFQHSLSVVIFKLLWLLEPA